MAPSYSSQHSSQSYRQHRCSLSEVSCSAGRSADSRKGTFPFSFIRPSEPNTSSTSLVPSTAEGRPIPVDGSTVENRTSALREYNNNYPSRHRYAKSTGAKSSTYSEPVIVRSYYSPLPIRPISTARGGVIVHGGAGTVSQSGGSAIAERRSLPFSTTVTSARNGMLSRMARVREKKRFRTEGPLETKLPPVEAFTFRSFTANTVLQDGGSDINADLDRIAEICAKSRYSLSNQYEVHYTPHGSSSSIAGTSLRENDIHGPTLQAVSSEDERSLRRQRKRRNGARRSSRAMGTLETIMSSSRSSDDERTKKRSAAEIANQVRGRTAGKYSGHTSPTNSSQSVADDQHSPIDTHVPKTPTKKKSASLALIDNSNLNFPPGDPSTPRNSSTNLVGEPARPQASTSQLEIRTAPERPVKEKVPRRRKSGACPLDRLDALAAKVANSHVDRDVTGTGLFSTLSNWIPWRPSDAFNRSPGRAEGSLRELLRNTDVKGKGILYES